jgi:hypothetical protein
LSIIEENKCGTDKNMRILLGNIFGVCYSMTFSVCLVSVQNTDTILFTLSFEDTKPLSTRDLETSKGFGKKVRG